MGNEPNNTVIGHLQPRGFLSFGRDFPGIGLNDLNVLIGANGSGKSNLLEAISLLRASRPSRRRLARVRSRASDPRRRTPDSSGAGMWADLALRPSSSEAGRGQRPSGPGLVVRFVDGNRALRSVDSHELVQPCKVDVLQGLAGPWEAAMPPRCSRIYGMMVALSVLKRD
jgi:hypothetical protein